MACAKKNLTEQQIAHVDALKKKVICEFQDWMIRLQKGHKDDYNLILEKISLIELIESFDIEDPLFINQFYINLNKWQTVTY